MKTFPLILCLGAGLLTACASHKLRDTFFEQIHEGDSKEHVLDVLGPPDQFGPSQRIPGATAWYYTRSKDVCGLALKEDKVALTACTDNPQYVNRGMAATAAFLNGMGQGMSNAGSQGQSVNCTTSKYGSTAYTNCR